MITSPGNAATALGSSRWIAPNRGAWTSTAHVGDIEPNEPGQQHAPKQHLLDDRCRHADHCDDQESLDERGRVLGERGHLLLWCSVGEQQLEERRRDQDDGYLKPEPGGDTPPGSDLYREAEVAPETAGAPRDREDPHGDQVPAGLPSERCRERHDGQFRSHEDEYGGGGEERTEDAGDEDVEHLRQAPLHILQVVAHLRSDRSTASRSNRMAR